VLACLLAVPPAVHAVDDAASQPAAQTAASAQSLLHVRWALLSLGQTEIAIPKGGRRPHMTLGTASAASPGASAASSPAAHAGRLRGFGGCNRMHGAFDLDGARLTFGPGVGMTRMACPNRAALDLESGFAQALQACARWRIVNGGLDGPALELLDGTGTVLARFVHKRR
jgi:heat shock protein HslJ